MFKLTAAETAFNAVFFVLFWGQKYPKWISFLFDDLWNYYSNWLKKKSVKISKLPCWNEINQSPPGVWPNYDTDLLFLIFCLKPTVQPVIDWLLTSLLWLYSLRYMFRFASAHVWKLNFNRERMQVVRGCRYDWLWRAFARHQLQPSQHCVTTARLICSWRRWAAASIDSALMERWAIKYDLLERRKGMQGRHFESSDLHWLRH